MAIPLSNLFDPNKKNKPSPIQTSTPTSPSSVQQPRPITEGQQAVQPTTTFTPVPQPVVQETQQAVRPKTVVTDTSKDVLKESQQAAEPKTVVTEPQPVLKESQRIAGETTITKDTKTGETKTTRTPDSVFRPSGTDSQATKTEPPEEQTVQTELDAIAEQMARWAAGDIDDPVLKKQVNNYIQTIGVVNQTGIEDLEQRIASDPNLAGQGAGIGLLMMMNRENNYNFGKTLSELTVESANRIMDFQQYGIGKTIELEQVRYDRAKDGISTLISAGDYDGAAKGLKDFADKYFPGIPFNVTPEMIADRDFGYLQGKLDLETGQFNLDTSKLDTQLGLVKDLIGNGDFQGGADGLNELFRSMGLVSNITPDMLQNRDATEMENMNARLRGAAEIAAVDPEEAEGIIQGIMDDYPEFFQGMTAENVVKGLIRKDPTLIGDVSFLMETARSVAATDPEEAVRLLEDAMKIMPGAFGSLDPQTLVDAWVSGEFDAGLPGYREKQTEINTLAGAGAGYSEAAKFYNHIDGLYRNFTEEGRGLSLEEVNELYTINGMRTVGSLEELDDEDLKELGQMADYQQRKEDFSAENIRNSIMEAILADPNAQKYVNEDIYGKGGMNSLDKVVTSLYLGGGYEIDHLTGIITPKFGDQNLMFWDIPEEYHNFYTWPAAEFNDDGTPKEGYYPGGHAYDTLADGDGFFSESNKDEELDQKWINYVNNNKDDHLTAQQWYFATQGGKTATVDESLIPENIKPTGGSTGGGGNDGLNVGLTEEQWDKTNNQGTATWEDALAAYEEGILHSTNTLDVPTNEDTFRAFLDENPSGYTNIGGQVYHLTAGTHDGTRETYIETQDGLNFINRTGTNHWLLNLRDVESSQGVEIESNNKDNESLVRLTRIPTEKDLEGIRQFEEIIKQLAAEAKKQGKKLVLRSTLMDYLDNGTYPQANVNIPIDTYTIPDDVTSGGGGTGGT